MKKIVLIAISIFVFSGSVFAGMKHVQKNYPGGTVDSQRGTQDASWVGETESDGDSRDIEV